MRILAIDTSTDMTALALVQDSVVLGSAEHTDARGHVEAIGVLFTQIDQLDVTRSDFEAPDVVVCGVGPGPFTGLRVGIAFGESLALAWRVPIVGICSLDAVARNIVRTTSPDSEFIAVTDARRGEYYWARYAPDGQRLSGPSVDKKEVVEQMSATMVAGHHPLGVDLAECLGSAEQLPITPLYLRPPDAQPATKTPASGVGVQL